MIKEETKAAGGKVDVIIDYEKIETVKKQMAKLTPVKIDFDSSMLSENEKKALDLMVKAAKYMDKIFLRQVYSENEVLEKELMKKENPDFAVLKDYFKIQFGPFYRRDHKNPFINLK